MVSRSVSGKSYRMAPALEDLSELMQVLFEVPHEMARWALTLRELDPMRRDDTCHLTSKLAHCECRHERRRYEKFSRVRLYSFGSCVLRMIDAAVVWKVEVGKHAKTGSF